MAFITIDHNSSAVSAVPRGPHPEILLALFPFEKHFKTIYFFHFFFYFIISILLLPFAIPSKKSEETDKFLFFFFFGWVGHSLVAFHQ
jgi:hypothetical protein